MRAHWTVLGLAALAALAWFAWPGGGDAAQPAARPEARAGAAPEASATGRDATAAPGSSEQDRERRELAARESAVEAPRASQVHGRVVDLRRAPIRGARVQLESSQRGDHGTLDVALGLDVLAEGVTDADGTFAFDARAGRVYQLRARAAGYAELARPDCRVGEALELVLQPGATVLGTVTRESDRSAVSGARVRAEPSVPEGATRTLGAGVSGTTDGSGFYRLDGLAPGTWELSVAAEGLAMASELVLELHAGARERRDVALADGLRVFGRVFDSRTGLGIAGAEVGEGWRYGRSVRTEMDGRYEFRGFSPRQGYLYARAAGYGEREAIAKWDGDFDSADFTLQVEVDFALEHARRARGRVVDPEGAPVAGAYVAAAASDYGGPEDIQRTDWAAARTGAGGEFELEGLRPELRHTLVVRKDGYGAIVYEFPDDELEHDPVELGDVALAKACRVWGEVVDESGDPYPGHEVALVGSNADRFARGGTQDRDERSSVDSYVATRTQRTDARGRFEFLDVAPGDYTLRASPPASHELREVQLAVPADCSHTAQRLVFERGLALAGRVVASDGGAAPKCYVSIDPEQSGRSADAECASDGTFRVAGLTPGPYQLSVYPYASAEEQRSGRLFAIERVSGIAAGREDVVVRLRLLGVARGVVLDLDGQPVAGARVRIDARDDLHFATGQTDALGRFELRVDDAVLRYELSAAPPQTDAGRSEALAVTLPATDLVLRLDWRP